MKTLLHSIWRTFLDILFPLACLGCKRPGTALCLTCLQTVPPPEKILDETIYSLFSYRHPLIRRSIWMLKYKNRPGITESMGKVLYERMIMEYDDLLQFKNFRSPIVIPIPLSKKREHSRGYNQAALLSRAALLHDVEKLFSYSDNLVLRARDTKPQAHIKNRMRRLENIRGSFIVPSQGEVRGKNIILIDDVTTTGATVREVKSVLKKAGARHIVAFTIAH